MGFRTVVMLSNDCSHEWINDPQLGKKILHAMHECDAVGNYGRVVECVHADTQTLAVLDFYVGFKELSRSQWGRDEEVSDMHLGLLKEAAEKMGYRLSRKPSAKKEK